MRLKIFLTTITFSFALLAVGLFNIQILKGHHYRFLSEQNRILIVPLGGPRGKIYDRKKRPLVDNRIAFDLSFVYKETKDLERLSSLISEVLKINKNNLASKMRSAKKSPYTPMLLVEDIGRERAIVLEQYRMDYPALIVTSRIKRDYLHGDIASSVVGYLGKISEEEIARFEPYGYRRTDLVGKTGLEKKYDSYLKPLEGGMQIEVDALGRQKDVLRVNEPQSGRALYLTLDIDLQEYCDSLLDKKRGSIIVLNPNNGEVYAFVSKPDFDPNIFIKSGTNKEIQKILKNEGKDYPLLNRGISCAYPPGSIFKLIVAAAALESGMFSKNETFACSGAFNLSRRVFHCWKEEGHGEQSIDEAIKNSCNVFFYQLGLRTGVNDISLYAKKFGFGKPTGIDLPGEISGTVPTSQWKAFRKLEKWYPGDTVNYSIGQGYLLVTPIQVISMMSAFANGGYLVKPYIVDRIDNIKVSSPISEKIGISDSTIDLIRVGLKKVVNDPHGTGMKAKMEDIIVAGKTGTAQTPEGNSHGWFSGFAPFKDPKICALVFIEFGGKGGLEASIIARKVMEKSREVGLL